MCKGSWKLATNLHGIHSNHSKMIVRFKDKNRNRSRVITNISKCLLNRWQSVRQSHINDVSYPKINQCMSKLTALPDNNIVRVLNQK